jgi:hypothetical protein
VGRFFSSFEEAWEAFLVREEPLEDFFGSFPDEEAYLTMWLAPPGAAACAEAAVVQRELSGLVGLVLTPRHWLHVSLGPGSESELEAVRERLHGFGSFDAEYGPATCFHEAHVLEVRSARFAELARTIDAQKDLAEFLPHLSIAYVEGRPPPGPSREVLASLRDRSPIRDLVSEVQLCVVPVGRGSLFDPWRVAATVRL